MIADGVEILFYLVGFALIARHPEVRDLATKLPPRYCAVSIGIVALVVMGHLVRRPNVTFPFVDWRMYTRSAPSDLAVFEYTGVSDTQMAQRVDVLGVAHSLGIGWPLRGLIARFNGAQDDAARGDYERRCRDLLRSLVASYNQRHPADAIRVLHVWRRRIPIHDYHGPDSIPRELLWEISVPSQLGTSGDD